MAEKAIDKVVAAYENTPKRSVVVPEWGGMEVFFNPVTVADMKAVEAQNPKTEYDHNLYLIIRKAKDAEGKGLFQPGDKSKLESRVDMAALIRLVQALSSRIPKAEGEAKKAIEADPT